MIGSSSNPIKLLILGAGGFAMDVADLVSDIPGIQVAGFVVNILPYIPGSTLLGKPIHWVDELSQFDDSYRAVCALGTTKRHHFTQSVEELGLRFTTVIHPTARISSMAMVGLGTVINSGVQVAAHAKIGRHVIINRGALIGHHNVIHDHATLSPGSNLAGNVTIGERVYVGLGANILQNVTIGKQSVVGAGALVTQDIPKQVKVMGIPARIVEEGVEGL